MLLQHHIVKHTWQISAAVRTMKDARATELRPFKEKYIVSGCVNCRPAGLGFSYRLLLNTKTAKSIGNILFEIHLRGDSVTMGEGGPSPARVVAVT